MKSFLFALAAVFAGSVIVAGDVSNATVVIQDLGAALNPNDPTNGGFWSIDWTDDQQVRHTHAGVTVEQVPVSCATTFETSDLVVWKDSAPVPLYLGPRGLVITIR